MMRVLKFLHGVVDVQPPDFSKFNPAPGQDSEDAFSEHVDDEEEVTVIPGWVPSLTLEVMAHAAMGEEDEDELFCQRCKLFRFSCETWNDCGVGHAKLLKHKVTGNVRFLFRVEKTLKILANHGLCETMTYCDLERHTITPNCWVWMAPDCSTGVVVVRRLALKFKSEEVGMEFQKRFNAAKGQSIQNHAQANNPSGLVGAQAPTSSPSGGGAGTIRRTSARKISSELCAAILPDISHLEEVNQDGNLTEMSVSSETFFDAISEHSSGQPSASSSHDLQEDNGSCDESDDVAGHSFKDDGLGGIARVPGWSPPLAIDVAVGEENEKEMFRQRAKLFRFRNDNWDFCGVGDVKLLTHNATALSRFVFRLQGTMQIVANHYIIDCFPYCHLQQMGTSERCWLWAALDCASVPTQAAQFALKFDNAQLATDFKDAFEKGRTPSPEIQEKLKGSDVSAVQHDDWMQFEAFFACKPVEFVGSRSDMVAAERLRSPADAARAPHQKGEQCAASSVVAFQNQAGEAETSTSLPLSRAEVESPNSVATPNQAPRTSSSPGHLDADYNSYAAAKRPAAVDMWVTSAKEASASQEGSHGQPDKKRRASGSEDVGMASFEQDRRNGSCKTRKTVTEHFPHAAAATQSQLALGHIAKLLMEACSMDISNGLVHYEEIVASAIEIAMMARSHSDLPARIHAVAFAPCPRTGTWASNTPTCHQSALKQLITTSGVIAVIEFLHAAVDIDTNHGNTECYLKIVQRAGDIAETLNISPGLSERIQTAAFMPLRGAGKWMPNTPSCHRRALLGLVRILSVARVKKLLERASGIDASLGSAHYQELVQQAQDVAAASRTDASLPGRIADAAFKVSPTAIPSFNRAAFEELARSL